ncbi:EpsG family protein [Flavobacterium sp. UBA6031]|uniref:EpsG family protein n=1 Tax=Flavobacterium sp. UBA6031 TaxID=1946551 RepID=UPI0025C0E6D2|nr:EpsG family protein [Flavobacterium sp. UBA6031]
MSYSLPYILIIVFFLGISVIQLGIPLDEKSRKYLNYFVIIAYVLFFGFRGFIATDWMNYYSTFKILPTNFIHALNVSSFEPGFVIYSVLIKKIFPNYETFQLLNTITNIILLNIFFKRYLNEKYYALGFAVFVAFFGYIFEINLLRNFKSLLIFLLALKYIENRNWLKYYLCVILALLFHWTSIVFIPLYFFLHKKINIRILIGIFVVGTFVYLLQFEYVKPLIKSFSKLLPLNMGEKIAGYLGSETFGGSYGLTFGYFERTLIMFLILFYYKSITNNKSNILFVNSYLIFIAFYLYFSEVSIIIVRMASIFAYSYWIIIPLIIMNMQKNIKPIMFLFISLLLIAKIHMVTNSLFYEYDSLLAKNYKTYEERIKIYDKNKKILEKK